MPRPKQPASGRSKGEGAPLSTHQAHPRVSPDGTTLAYVAWNHPSMPWDATELRVAAVTAAAAAPATEGHELVDGKAGAPGAALADSDVSVLQPAWHPGTGALYYISDSSGFNNLRRLPPPPLGGFAGQYSCVPST